MFANDYFEQALELFVGHSSIHTDCLNLAGRSIQLKTPSPVLRAMFTSSLLHLLTEQTGTNPDLVIWYGEGKDLPKILAAPPWKDFNVQGFREDAGQDDVQIFFLPWQRQVFLYSRVRRTGIYWVASVPDVPWWEPTFSFRVIFHLWTRDLPAQLVHAGAIACGDKGVLITGPSGSGKSTSCLNLLRAGFKYLGDDYVWVELELRPVVYALYQTAKVEAQNFDERFADLKPFVINPGSYHKQKAIIDIEKFSPGLWQPSIKISAVLLPKVMPQEATQFIRTKQSAAFFAMAPTTLHHLPHHREIAYKKFIGISSALSAYKWYLGSDIVMFQSSFEHFILNEAP